jgi:hypothetical protein
MLLIDGEEVDAPEDLEIKEFGDNYNEEYVQVHNGKMNGFISPQ